MTVTRRLAAFVRETEAVPPGALAAACRCVIDLAAASLGGWGTPGAAAARAGAARTFGTGACGVWFTGLRLTAPGAAFANAAMACQLDLDDGHRAAAGHLGASIIPAALATAEELGSAAEELLAAICLGYEVGIRVSASRDLTRVPTTDSGVWCGLGAVAAAGRLRGTATEALAQALAICGTTAPSQSATPYTKLMGNHVKEGIPMATAGALAALDLAEAGFTGPLDILDEQSRYAQGALLGGLGADWLIEGTYFKPYSACRWAHAAVDALLEIQGTHGIEAASIGRIDVETFGRALTLNNEVAPTSIEGAQYSIPFCLGLAGVDGTAALLPMTAASLTRSDALDLAAKVRLSVDPDLDAMFPAAVPARVKVVAGGTIFERTVLTPKGEPANPMTDTELFEKLRSIARSCASISAFDRLAGASAALERGDAEPLLHALRSLRIGGEPEVLSARRASL